MKSRTTDAQPLPGETTEQYYDRVQDLASLEMKPETLIYTTAITAEEYAAEHTEPAQGMQPRELLLQDSIRTICGVRNAQYGPPTQDFQRTAEMANAFGFRVGDEPLKSHHVAIFMEILKLSRKRWSPGKRDHWLDTAGYSGCGWECVVAEGIAEDEPPF